jgi:hypothetical protein
MDNLPLEIQEFAANLKRKAEESKRRHKKDRSRPKDYNSPEKLKARIRRRKKLNAKLKRNKTARISRRKNK